MRKCPNCGTQMEDDIVRCPGCGNPMTEGRPWDKNRTDPNDGWEPPKVKREDDGIPHIRLQAREKNKDNRYISTQEREWYLNDDFVVKTGYCVYSRTPDNMEKTEEGTAVLTKRALLFGASEHAVRCAQYTVEIPVELISYVTDGEFRGHAAFVICCSGGERFIMYTGKKREWIEYFESVTEYRPDITVKAAEPAESGVKGKNPGGWGKIIAYLLCAVLFFVFAVTCEEMLLKVVEFVLGGGMVAFSLYELSKKLKGNK